MYKQMPLCAEPLVRESAAGAWGVGLLRLPPALRQRLERRRRAAPQDGAPARQGRRRRRDRTRLLAQVGCSRVLLVLRVFEFF